VLQPVQDGLVDDISDYIGYNCFEDAVTGRSRTFKVVRWKQYHDARRWKEDKSAVRIEDYTDEFELRYERLPGYENLSQAEYADMMRRKLRVRTDEIVRKRIGRRALGPRILKLRKPGTRPFATKSSTRTDHRPRVLSKDPIRRTQGEAWYFWIYSKFKRASAAYRSGADDYEFPEGTYKPPSFTVGYDGKML